MIEVGGVPSTLIAAPGSEGGPFYKTSHSYKQENHVNMQNAGKEILCEDN